MVIVGCLIQKSDKYLLVQEAKAKCRGKWNLPAGHLDPGETVLDGAKREAKEETGCDVELTGVCQIGNRVLDNDIFVGVIFTTKLISENIKFNPSEILDVKWFTYEEILAMQDQIRNKVLMSNAIKNAQRGITAPLDIINFYGD